MKLPSARRKKKEKVDKAKGMCNIALAGKPLSHNARVFVGMILSKKKSSISNLSLCEVNRRIKRFGVAENIEVLCKDMDYYEFLQTTYWKIAAHAAKRRADYRCSICGDGQNKLHTHHRDYRIVGREMRTLNGLVCLCEYCHDEIHKSLKVRKRVMNSDQEEEHDKDHS